LKIAIVSKAKELGGGASKVAWNLVEVLRQNDHFVKHYRRDLEYGYSEESSCMYGKYEKIAKKSFYKLKYMGFQEIIPWEYFYLKQEIEKYKFDIIHFHDLSTAVSPLTLMFLSKKLPVFWTLHDFSPVTGGCIYPIECKNYLKLCHQCPQLNKWPIKTKIDLTFFYHFLKKKIWKENITFISPSNYLKQELESLKYIKKNINVIYNYVDTDIFNKYEKHQVRKELNLPENRFMIILIAHSLSDKRKGFLEALDVINKLKRINPYVIIVGNKSKELTNIFDGLDTYFTNFIDNKKLLNKYYASADIFLNCSLADNLPLVVLESLASGTPVFGFDTGDIKEMIVNDYNGFLVKQKDVKNLAKKIKEIYTINTLKKMQKNASNIEYKFTKECFYKSHMKAYSDFLNKILKS
jgi:glycosyltransferase involved in cell wall biosynthesis